MYVMFGLASSRRHLEQFFLLACQRREIPVAADITCFAQVASNGLKLLLCFYSFDLILCRAESADANITSSKYSSISNLYLLRVLYKVVIAQKTNFAS